MRKTQKELKKQFAVQNVNVLNIVISGCHLLWRNIGYIWEITYIIFVSSAHSKYAIFGISQIRNMLYLVVYFKYTQVQISNEI